jgi:tRNA nucleotidyltransferase/poly(A) polymerase
MAIALCNIDKIKNIHMQQGTTTNIEQYIIDPVSGIDDLKNKNIKLTYDKAFIDDPIRMLRGFRIAANYDFNIDSRMLEIIHNMRTTILDCSGERVWAELINIFSTSRCLKVIEYMDESKILEILLPQIQKMKEVGKCTYHTVDSWTHTKSVLARVNEIIEYIDNEKENNQTVYDGKSYVAKKYITKVEFKPFMSECFNEYILNRINESFEEGITKAHSKQAILRIAALLHDIEA